ncbi:MULTISPECIES: DNA-3-methyladenine glycosylase I [Acetobacter]|uniref:DNA-3-methyladenine glycosylase I n=1 Tax=Acetobacter TaxID=434 RepID=UPI00209DF05B|nr:DNA-3-methyladenine glycosylase I [Acetobacter lovaniensis]MCP1238951.1 DNA-3-methyladenine glycosylase I [Acetobacter lovaniensis]
MLTQSPESVALFKLLKKRRLTFVGPVIVYAWMQSIELVDDHAPSGHGPDSSGFFLLACSCSPFIALSQNHSPLNRLWSYF